MLLETYLEGPLLLKKTLIADVGAAQGRWMLGSRWGESGSAGRPVPPYARHPTCQQTPPSSADSCLPGRSASHLQPICSV